MLPSHSPLNNRINPRNKTRSFLPVAKPLKIPRLVRPRSKSRSRNTGEPEPRAGVSQAPLQLQTPLDPGSPRPVLRDVAGVEWPRSTSLGNRRHGPVSKGESPGHRRRARGARLDTLTHAHPHTCNVHTPGWRLQGTEGAVGHPAPLSAPNTPPPGQRPPSHGHPLRLPTLAAHSGSY